MCEARVWGSIPHTPYVRILKKGGKVAMSEECYVLIYICDDCGLIIAKKNLTEVAFEYWCGVADDGIYSDSVEIRGNRVIRYTYCKDCVPRDL